MEYTPFYKNWKIMTPIALVFLVFLGFILFKHEPKTNTPNQDTQGYSILNKEYSTFSKLKTKVKPYENALIGVSMVQSSDTVKYPISTADDLRNTLNVLKTKLKNAKNSKEVATLMGYNYDDIKRQVDAKKPLDREKYSIVSTYKVDYYFDTEEDNIKLIVTSQINEDNPLHLAYMFDSTGNLLTPTWLKGS